MLPKRYDAKDVERKWQKKWKREGIYRFRLDSNREVYSIDTPPPFTSGTLHMGHIYNHVWIDIVARYKRMKGFNVYFPQGFDCHGLPTELKVENELNVSKENREEFLKRCIEWTNLAIKRMREQFDRIGYSSDWDYSYRTMDDSYKRLVQKTLLIFYKKNLLYREKHPVLWCPRCETALAKAEIGHIEKDGKLYYIDLKIDDEHKITIATTRPEMMPACVAVLVHPQDERYKKFIGREAILPIFNRKVPIIADDSVDREFGTGAVYLCTFGDEQDIEWQKKYGLPIIEVIDKKGRMTENAGRYKGMKVEEARRKIAEDLIEIGSIRKIEKIKHQVVAHTERSSCRASIELIPLEQWFINVKDFIREIIETSRNMNWYPEYMLQRLIDWSEAMDWDWVISRQRIFGTPLPFWICSCGEIIPADESELPVDPRGTKRRCPKCGGMAIGEEDVCDCWVDSSITPLVISKWMEDDEFFKRTYPSSLRPQGYEIIRTWAFYTIYRCLILTDKACFKDLLINGMVAGPDGRKMSKSLGNVIEPDEPLKKYSADTIRQWAASGTLGDDYPFSWEECEHSHRFLTKFWNICRFIQIHLKDFDPKKKYEL
ncbi:MAG: valine--tRNA ligase, partial [Candidatus Altiarchaeales archaeon]